jgi:predicted nucleic acid-binding protein
LILVDTGFWLAAAIRSDRHHQAARQAVERLREPLVTTWPVMTETCHLLLSRVGTAPVVQFVRSAEQGAFDIFVLDTSHLSRVAALMDQYADLPMDLADASLVVLAEQLGSGRILSTDHRDFHAYRWKDHEPFENLLERP